MTWTFLDGAVTLASTMDAWRPAPLATLCVGSFSMLPTVDDESSMAAGLKVLSSPDCRYFLLSGMVRRW